MSKKQLRELAIAEEKQRRFREEQDASPLSRPELDELLSRLAALMFAHEPTHDLTHTTACLQAMSLNVDDCLKYLASRGMSDDYDVAMGADPCSLFGPTEMRLASMPLEQEELETLLDWLEAQVAEHGCDHSHRFVVRWLEEHSAPVSTTRHALMRQGGYCDCEVIYNVDPENIYPRTPR